MWGFQSDEICPNLTISNNFRVKYTALELVQFLKCKLAGPAQQASGFLASDFFSLVLNCVLKFQTDSISELSSRTTASRNR